MSVSGEWEKHPNATLAPIYAYHQETYISSHETTMILSGGSDMAHYATANNPDNRHQFIALHRKPVGDSETTYCAP